MGVEKVRKDDTALTFEFLFRFNRVFIYSRLLLLLDQIVQPTIHHFTVRTVPFLYDCPSFNLFIQNLLWQ